MIYLDNAATSRPKPPEVLQAMNDFMNDVCANSGRSGHHLAIQASRVVYETRESIAHLFNISNPLQIIFTMNATESLNLALHGILKPGDHVITSSMEHNSVMRPLRFLESCGVELTVVKCSQDGFLDAHDIENFIKENTKMVAINHGSNVIGSLAPIREIGNITRKHGVLFLLDTAQTAGALPIDMNDMKIDLLAFTGHKSLCGPPGIGGLCIREDIKIKPLKQGGTGSRSEEEYQPELMPDVYESGTLNLVGIAGLGAGVRYIMNDGVENIRVREVKLTQRMIDGLREIPGVDVYGHPDANLRVGVISFNTENISPSKVGLILDEDYDIMCRVGLHCAPIAHKTIGTFPDGTVRFGLGTFTTQQEVNAAVDAVKELSRQSKNK
ncbi:aminotransferase class V-fold PLP-dependent enzyme [Candidatus Poribacteria bacterium]|nr:aminotransferase class V-fold PLP-dependent enzyme [Candidatus Poribacteria bacterium]